MPSQFVLTVQLALQKPQNVQAVRNSVEKALSGLNAQVDVKVNRAGINSLNQSLNATKNNLRDTAQGGSKATADLNALTGAFAQASRGSSGFAGSQRASTGRLREFSQAGKEATAISEQFGRTVGFKARELATYTLAAGAVYGLVRAMGDGVREAMRFERELVKLTQQGATVHEVQAIEKAITRMSTSFGVSSQELAKVAVTFQQTGMAMKDVEKATEAVAKASLAPNFGSMKEATEGAISVMRIFNVDASQMEKVLNSINSVAGAFASESADLITGIKRAGAGFAAAGGSLNQLLALMSTVRSTTRESAESIATGLKTIFARMERQSTIESLKQLGIQLRHTREEAQALGNSNLEGTFVGPYEAIQRIAAALKGLPTNSLRFAQISETLGGYRQLTKLLPMLQQVTEAQKAYTVAQYGGISISNAAAQAQQTMLVRLEQIREQFLALFRTIVSSSAFQAFTDFLLKSANLLTTVADKLSFLMPLVMGFAAVKVAQGVSGIFRNGPTALAGASPFVARGRYASGGVVPGTGDQDSHPALLTPGEFVIRKQAAQRIGYGKLEKMNAGGYCPPEQMYADGGLAGTEKSPDRMTEKARFAQGGYCEPKRMNAGGYAASDCPPTMMAKGGVATKKKDSPLLLELDGKDDAKRLSHLTADQPLYPRQRAIETVRLSPQQALSFIRYERSQLVNSKPEKMKGGGEATAGYCEPEKMAAGGALKPLPGAKSVYATNPGLIKKAGLYAMARGGYCPPEMMAKGGIVPVQLFAGGGIIAKITSLRKMVGFGARATVRAVGLSSNKVKEDLTRLIPEDAEFLKSGTEAFVLRSPTTGDVFRIALIRDKKTKRGRPFQGRPDLPEVLQPLSSHRVGRFLVERLPFVNVMSSDTPGWQEAEKELASSLLSRGYRARDLTPWNMARLPGGRPVVVDPGDIFPTDKQPKKFTRGGYCEPVKMAKGGPLKPLPGAKGVYATNPGLIKRDGLYAMATGGIVPGQGDSDTVPALLTPGEFVIKKSSAKAIGYENLHRLNRGQRTPDKMHKEVRYAEGGHVLRLAQGGKTRFSTNDIREILAEFKEKTGINFARYVDTVKFEDDLRPTNNQAAKGRLGAFRYGEKRTIHLNRSLIRNKSHLREVLAHELGHAVDLGLGRGNFLSEKEGTEASRYARQESGLLRNYHQREYGRTFTGTKAQYAYSQKENFANLFRYYLLDDDSEEGKRARRGFGRKVIEKAAFLSNPKHQAKNLGFFSNLARRKGIIGGTARFFGFAEGGSQDKNQKIPALLTPGEFVFGKEAVERVGVSTLRHMNESGRLSPSALIKRFAEGGQVEYGQLTPEQKQQADEMLAKLKIKPFAALKINVAEGQIKPIKRPTREEYLAYLSKSPEAMTRFGENFEKIDAAIADVTGKYADYHRHGELLRDYGSKALARASLEHDPAIGKPFDPYPYIKQQIFSKVSDVPKTAKLSKASSNYTARNESGEEVSLLGEVANTERTRMLSREEFQQRVGLFRSFDPSRMTEEQLRQVEKSLGLGKIKDKVTKQKRERTIPELVQTITKKNTEALKKLYEIQGEKFPRSLLAEQKAKAQMLPTSFQVENQSPAASVTEVAQENGQKVVAAKQRQNRSALAARKIERPITVREPQAPPVTVQATQEALNATKPLVHTVKREIPPEVRQTRLERPELSVPKRDYVGIARQRRKSPLMAVTDIPQVEQLSPEVEARVQQAKRSRELRTRTRAIESHRQTDILTGRAVPPGNFGPKLNISSFDTPSIGLSQAFINESLKGLRAGKVQMPGAVSLTQPQILTNAPPTPSNILTAGAANPLTNFIAQRKVQAVTMPQLVRAATPEEVGKFGQQEVPSNLITGGVEHRRIMEEQRRTTPAQSGSLPPNKPPAIPSEEPHRSFVQSGSVFTATAAPSYYPTITHVAEARQQQLAGGGIPPRKPPTLTTPSPEPPENNPQGFFPTGSTGGYESPKDKATRAQKPRQPRRSPADIPISQEAVNQYKTRPNNLDGMSYEEKIRYRLGKAFNPESLHQDNPEFLRNMLQDASKKLKPKEMIRLLEGHEEELVKRGISMQEFHTPEMDKMQERRRSLQESARVNEFMKMSGLEHRGAQELIEGQTNKAIEAKGGNRMLSAETKMLMQMEQIGKVRQDLINAEARLLMETRKGIKAEEALKIAAEHADQALNGFARVVVDAEGKMVGVEHSAREAAATGITPPGGAEGPPRIPGIRGRIGGMFQNIRNNGLVRGLGRVGEVLNNKISMGAMFALPFVSQGIEHLGGKAEETVDSGKGGFTAAQGASGMLTGAATGAFAGSMLGPVGTTIGAVGGALVGLVSSIQSASAAIRDAHIGKAVMDFSKNLEIMKGGFVGNDRVSEQIGKITDIRKGINQKATEESTHFFSGFNTEEFTKKSEEQFQTTFGSKAGEIATYLNTQAEELGRTHLKDRISDLEDVFRKGNRGLNEDYIAILAQLKGVSRADVTKGFLEVTKRERDRIKATENQKKADASEARQLAQYQQLSLAAEMATRSLVHLQTQAQTATNIFGNQFTPIHVAGGIGTEASLIGGPDKKAFSSALSAISQPFGTLGKDFQRSGQAIDEVSRVLPHAIAQAMQEAPLEGKDLDVRIMEITRGMLGGTGRIKDNQELLNALGVASHGLAQLKPEDVVAKTQSGDVHSLVNRVMDPLTTNFKTTSSQLSKLLTDRSNEFTNALHDSARMLRQIAEGDYRVAQARLAETLKANEIAAQRMGRPAGAMDLIPLSTLEGPFRSRQETLTGFNDERALSPAAIGREMSQTKTNLFAAIQERDKLAHEPQGEAGAAQKALEAATERVNSFQKRIADLNDALSHLRDTSQSAAAVMEKLRHADENRQSRLQFGERFLSSDLGGRVAMNRGMALLHIAHRQGDRMDNFSIANQRLVLETLNSLGNARLPGLGGTVASDMKTRLISQFGGNAQGRNGLFAEAAGQKEQRQNLEKSLLDHFKTAREAEQELQNQKRADQDKFITDQNNLQTQFFEKLGEYFKGDQTRRTETEYITKSGEQQSLQQREKSTSVLREVGVGPQAEDLRRLQTPAAMEAVKDLMADAEKARYSLDHMATPETIRDQFQHKNFEIRRPNAKGEVVETLKNRFGLTTTESDIAFEKVQNRLEEIANQEARSGKNTTIQEVQKQHFNEETYKVVNEIQRSKLIAAQSSFRNKLNNENLGLTEQQKGGFYDVLMNQQRGQELYGAITNTKAEDWAKLGTELKSVSQALKSLENTLKQQKSQLYTRLQQQRAATAASYVLGHTQGGFIYRATGGVVYRDNGGLTEFKPRGTDTVPAMLTPGEYVVRAKQATKHRRLLEAINRGDEGYLQKKRVQYDIPYGSDPLTKKKKEYAEGGTVYLAGGGRVHMAEPHLPRLSPQVQLIVHAFSRQYHVDQLTALAAIRQAGLPIAPLSEPKQSGEDLLQKNLGNLLTVNPTGSAGVVLPRVAPNKQTQLQHLYRAARRLGVHSVQQAHGQMLAAERSGMMTPQQIQEQRKEFAKQRSVIGQKETADPQVQLKYIQALSPQLKEHLGQMAESQAQLEKLPLPVLRLLYQRRIVPVLAHQKKTFPKVLAATEKYLQRGNLRPDVRETLQSRQAMAKNTVEWLGHFPMRARELDRDKLIALMQEAQAGAPVGNVSELLPSPDVQKPNVTTAQKNRVRRLLTPQEMQQKLRSHLLSPEEMRKRLEKRPSAMDARLFKMPVKQLQEVLETAKSFVPPKDEMERKQRLVTIRRTEEEIVELRNKMKTGTLPPQEYERAINRKTILNLGEQQILDFGNTQKLEELIQKRKVLEARRPTVPGRKTTDYVRISPDKPPRRFATGGYVHEGKGIDDVPARLTRGEYVLRREAVARIGKQKLDMMNGASAAHDRAYEDIRGFAEGGYVGNSNIPASSKHSLEVPSDFTKSLNRFTDSLSSLTHLMTTFSGSAQALAKAMEAMPRTIQMEGNFVHQVAITGGEALAALTPPLKEMVETAVENKLRKFVKDHMPSVAV